MYRLKSSKNGRRSKPVRVSGIVPGCLIKVLLDGEIVTSKVMLIRSNVNETTVVCNTHGRIVQVPLSDCRLYKPVVANITFNTNGEIVNEKKKKSSNA